MISRRLKRVSKALALAVPLSFFSGCAKKAVDDQALTTAIQSKLYSDAMVRQSGIGVAVSNGVVTLTGNVPSSGVEQQAMTLAKGTDGVKSVTDQMTVSAAAAAAPATMPPVPAPEPAPNTPTTALASKSPARESAATSSPAATTAQTAKESPAPKPLVPENVTIPAGTRLSVRTTSEINSKLAQDGQTYRASLDSPLVSRGRVIVPAGTDVTLVITGVKAANRIKGNSALSLKASSLTYRGKAYDISTSVIAEEGKARGKNTAIKTGIGAAAGALIGGLAGGGKGAGIGAAAGGGAGFGYNALTHGQEVKIPSETVLNFRMESPLTLPARGGSAAANSDQQQ